MQATTMTVMVAETMRSDRLAEAAQRRTRAEGLASGARLAHAGGAVTIRFARAADRPALERLASLDSRRAGWLDRSRDLLVAEIDGSLAAALPVERPDDAAADPFRRTREAVQLLQTRAAQVRRAGGRERIISQKRQIRPAL